MYNVYVNEQLIKSYPHRIQAIIWGIMHGFLYTGRCGTFFDKQFKIKEEK